MNLGCKEGVVSQVYKGDKFISQQFSSEPGSAHFMWILFGSKKFEVWRPVPQERTASWWEEEDSTPKRGLQVDEKNLYRDLEALPGTISDYSQYYLYIVYER